MCTRSRQRSARCSRRSTGALMRCVVLWFCLVCELLLVYAFEARKRTVQKALECQFDELRTRLLVHVSCNDLALVPEDMVLLYRQQVPLSAALIVLQLATYLQKAILLAWHTLDAVDGEVQSKYLPLTQTSLAASIHAPIACMTFREWMMSMAMFRARRYFSTSRYSHADANVWCAGDGRGRRRGAE